jgi:hypothetical protein
MTKLEIARQIFLASPGLVRKDMIKKFVAEVGMTEAGASTYYAKIKSETKDIVGELKPLKSTEQLKQEIAEGKVKVTVFGKKDSSEVESATKAIEIKEVRYVGIPMINGKPGHSNYTERFENGVLFRTAHGYQAS